MHAHVEHGPKALDQQMPIILALGHNEPNPGAEVPEGGSGGEHPAIVLLGWDGSGMESAALRRDVIGMLDRVRETLLAEQPVAEPDPTTLPAAAPSKGAAVREAGLSEREVEVLRWVATGMSNAQVAERLYLSPRTVEAHLHRIYRKLDVPSRAAAVHFAVARGLV